MARPERTASAEAFYSVGEARRYDGSARMAVTQRALADRALQLLDLPAGVPALLLDAGCGTGLVGVELKKHGFSNFYGADLSQKLLDLVPKDLYHKLDKVDLNKPINEKDNSFDAVMCVGTFTFGHVKPPALDEFIRITKDKGLICFTINEGIHEEYGFDKKIDQLNKDNKWKEIEFFKSDYIASKDVNAWLGLYEVIK